MKMKKTTMIKKSEVRKKTNTSSVLFPGGLCLQNRIRSRIKARH